MSIPFQATHTADDGRYYMVDECEWFYANHMGHWKRHWSGAPAGLKEMAKKSWSGAEDGLPPVGTVCELRTKRGGWGEAEIKYQGRRGICVWLWVRRDGNSEQVEWAESPDKLEFRAIRTPAQIASEKRETAIRELMDVADVDCRVTAARLVDAGFKR